MKSNKKLEHYLKKKLKKNEKKSKKRKNPLTHPKNPAQLNRFKKSWIYSIGLNKYYRILELVFLWFDHEINGKILSLSK